MPQHLSALLNVLGFRVLAVILTFAQAVALTRIFGAEAFGALAFAIAIISLVALIASAGFDRLLMREIAWIGPEHAAAHPSFIHLRRQICIYVVPLTVLASFLGIASAQVFASESNYRVPLLVTSATLPILMVRKFVEQLALGAKRSTLSFSGSNVIYPACLILGGLVAPSWLNWEHTAALAALYAAALLMSTLGVAALLWPTIKAIFGKAVAASGPGLGDHFVGYPNDIAGRRPLLSAIGLTVVASGFLIITQMDAILIGLLANSTEVAFSRVASRMAESVAIVRVAALLHFRPLLAEAYARKAHSTLAAHIRSLSGILTVSGLGLFATVVIFAEPLMTIFGDEFRGAVWVTRFYMLSVLLTMLAGVGPVLLSMSGREQLAARFVWVSAAVNLVGDLILIPPFGALGGALATCLAMVVLGVLGRRAAVRELSIDPSFLGLLRRPIPRDVARET